MRENFSFLSVSDLGFCFWLQWVEILLNFLEKFLNGARSTTEACVQALQREFSSGRVLGGHMKGHTNKNSAKGQKKKCDQHKQVF